ncbi:MAG: U32 family peptidase [Clostridiales bacterium]|nr:U32 family peptidase [Clostridiales bacterium]
MSIKLKKPELLAPAGGKAHLTAAVSNGADAVYMGGQAFNARIFADNFRDDELAEAVEYAHRRGVRIYITLNTLLRDDELVKAFEYANFLYSIGVDGLIVQDIGLARMLNRYIPDFPLHLSTQGTLYNNEAMELAAELGFCRVVPAREVSIDEIRSLAETGDRMDPPVDVEIFIHGAMCMCYSGQCQMSRMMGRKRGIAGATDTGSCRSGNRGTCAQPCRQAYTDENGRTYYALSPRDMCQIENIPELVLSGAASFKIEGRMKSPEYVAVVTGIYRKYIDRFDDLCRKYGPEEASEKYSVDPEDMLRLRQIFNRGDFTEGYLHGNPGEEFLSGMSPKNQGIYIGRAVAVIDSEYKVSEPDERKAAKGALRRGKELVCIEMSTRAEAEVRAGDGLEFRTYDDDLTDATGGVITYVKDIGNRALLVGDLDRGVRPGDLVFKVTDKQLAEEALNRPDVKLPVTMVFTAREGQYATLAMTDVRSGYSVEVTADHMVERARKAPTDAERIESNLSRLGDTPFTPGLTGIDVQIDDDIMMPVSVVNRMRREAADELLKERTESVLRKRSPLSRAKLDVIESGEMLGAQRLDEDGLRERVASHQGILFGDKYLKPVPLRVFMESENREGTIPYVLNVSKGNLDTYIRENFNAIAEASSETGILIGNLGWIRQFLDAGVRVYGDYGLNVMNEQARLAYEEAGVEIVVPSHETGISDVRGIPLMITEHPVQAETLIDRKGEKHRVVTAADGDKTLIY